ncbi:NB-ARC domain-containing protein [Streptomyces sp. NPDC020681]|uniref:NB-ARC domain-containing protein n=1 Tax=Streptomyces sp. NPDC020681 TaxID=3365083 RepID=UPI0037B6CE90
MNDIIDALADHLNGWALVAVLGALAVGGLAAGVFLAVRTGRPFTFGLPFGLGEARLEEATALPGSGPVPAIGSGADADDSGNGTAEGVNSAGSWRRYATGVDHDRLFGVDALITELNTILTGPGGNWVLSLYGGGGAGKTALAFDLVDRCRRTGHFDRIVWTSAKNAARESAFGERDPLALAYWQDVIGSISRQLGLDTEVSRALWEERLHDHLDALDPDKRILLVVDNLEGLEDATNVVESLRRVGLRQPHRLLLTNRYPDHSRHVISRLVPPLPTTDALALVRHIGSDDPSLVSLSDRKLEVVAQRTEGNPFLIKLVVRTYLESGRPIEHVLEELGDLGEGRPDSAQSDEPLGLRVRNYLFAQALAELEETHGRATVVQLIGAFGTRRAGDTFGYDDLQRISGIERDDAFAAVLRAACRMSLVRPSQVNSRYSIHSLLYEFTTQGS